MFLPATSIKIKRAFGFFDGTNFGSAGVDHGGSDTAVPQQLLNRANVVFGLQQMAGKTVVQRVGRGPLADLTRPVYPQGQPFFRPEPYQYWKGGIHLTQVSPISCGFLRQSAGTVMGQSSQPVQ